MRKKLMIFVFACMYGLALSQVGINTQTPHPSSVLDVNSDTKGVLVPRLTTTAVNDLSATASEGLIVFDKEKKTFMGWDGSKWQNLGYEENNTAPNASNVNVTGNYHPGETLTANYSYADAQGNPDDTSTFIWKKADNGSGANAADIPSANALNYLLTSAELGKYIQFCVTPGSSVGASPGIQKCSSWSGPVAAVANQAPTASAVSITGTNTQGQTLTGNYTYNDTEGDVQGSSTFRWTRSDDASGLNEATISGASASGYTLTAADINKYIKFYVTPIASTGTTTGTETGSGFVGPIASLPQTSVQFVSSSSSVSEGVGTTSVVLSITNPSAATATSVDVYISGGTGSTADINNYTTQTVTFPAGSSANQTVTITVTDDSTIESDETIIFGLQNVTGGNNNSADISGNTSHTLTITNNDVITPIALGTWDTTGLPGGTGNFGPSPWTGTPGTGVSTARVIREAGATQTGSGSANSWGSDGLNATSQSAAETANDAWTFEFVPQSGKSLSLSSIEGYSFRKSGSGPKNGQYQYKIGAGTWTDIPGATITGISGGTTIVVAQTAIDLSGISALQNVTADTTISIRLVLWGATASTGTANMGYQNQPIIIKGISQ
ncbi:hypothetical protein HNP38_001345 [Chryseobacterium defluvii]|uniref:Calx-beta domain-containing protein n=1 Tax=Chryseobacterium defluvii TaxID=160396 RepID=A0A840KEV6_9FLAO|nr:Calx-beta domain-containing protein [Chryseobacterium defluvii]MBB4806073.1 hypothetical protein [Chryseobacterium defluvii]